MDEILERDPNRVPVMAGVSSEDNVPVLMVRIDPTTKRMLVVDENSAAIAASLAIIDDWDESDRAKVNPIVGQAGVAGGSGVVSAATQRVVLATDVGLPSGTNLLGQAALEKTASSSLSNVASSATSVQLLAANSARKHVTIYNDSIQPMRIKYGQTASSASYSYRIQPGGTWEMPPIIYTGRIDAIWDAADGNARVTEL